MSEALTESLPLAIAIALSPIPIIATLLTMIARRPRDTSSGFMLGWTSAIAVVTAAFVFAWRLAVSPGDASAGSPARVLSLVVGLLGAVLLVLGVRQWIRRGTTQPGGAVPRWMSAVDSLSRPRAAGLGIVLCALNPKVVVICAAAGATIASSSVDTRAQVGAVLGFTIVAACTVTVPVIAVLVAGERAQAPLSGVRTWVELNSTTLASLLLMTVGLVLLAQGLLSLRR